MIYGITPQGFIRKPFSEILNEMIKEAQGGGYFGADIDLSPESPLGVLITLMAWAVDQQWKLMENIYYSLWLSTAEGVHLDRVTMLGFVSRQPAQPANVLVRFTGEVGAIVPKGTQVETAQQIVFETIDDVVISDEGYVDVMARCTQTGSVGLVQSGMISNIKTPVAGVDSVTNPSPSFGGRDIEHDVDLVERYKQLPAATGSSIEALYAAVMNTEGVVSAIVYENSSNIEDGNGLPPKSIECIVQGGSDSDVAYTILNKKAAGIQTHGSLEIEIIDDTGIKRYVKFSRPINVNVYVLYEITTNAEWSDENIIWIKRNAVKYIGGIDDNNNKYEGVGISKPVYVWKLIAAQSEVKGIDLITVKVGKSYPPIGSVNLEFLPRERAWTDTTMISVVKL